MLTGNPGRPSLRRMISVLALAAVALAGGCTSSTNGHPPASPTVPSVSPLPGPGGNVQLPKDFPLPAGGHLVSAKENPNGGVMLKYTDVSKGAFAAYLAKFAKAGWHRTTITSDSTGATYQLTKGQAQVGLGYTTSGGILTISYAGP